MSRIQAAAGLAAIALLSACAPAVAPAVAGGTATSGTATSGTVTSGTVTSGTVTSGTVAGRLLIEGGPIGPVGQQPGKRPVPGTVRFTSKLRRQLTVRVGNSGSFSVQLPPGTYAVCARSPAAQGPCPQARQITVTARLTTKIAFTFIVP